MLPPWYHLFVAACGHCSLDDGGHVFWKIFTSDPLERVPTPRMPLLEGLIGSPALIRRGDDCHPHEFALAVWQQCTGP
eukprot:5851648-Prymnesium_polylepis.1